MFRTFFSPDLRRLSMEDFFGAFSELRGVVTRVSEGMERGLSVSLRDNANPHQAGPGHSFMA